MLAKLSINRLRLRTLPIRTIAVRNYTPTTSLAARKNSQDKDSIDTRSYEYVRSGTDDDAVQSDGAFDPSTTKPDEELGRAENHKDGGANEHNPLDVSPANAEVSKQRPQQEGGAENAPSREGSQSGGGSPEKGGKI